MGPVDIIGWIILVAGGIFSLYFSRFYREHLWNEERAFYERFAKNYGGIHPADSFFARFQFDDTTVEYSTYAAPGRSKRLYTRLYAILPDRDLELEVFSEGWVARLGKILRLIRDLDTGDEEFDQTFVVQSRDEDAAEKYLTAKIRELLRKIYQTSDCRELHLVIGKGELVLDVEGAVFEEPLAYEYVQLTRRLVSPKVQ